MVFWFGLVGSALLCVAGLSCAPDPAFGGGDSAGNDFHPEPVGSIAASNPVLLFDDNGFSDLHPLNGGTESLVVPVSWNRDSFFDLDGGLFHAVWFGLVLRRITAPEKKLLPETDDFFCQHVLERLAPGRAALDCLFLKLPVAGWVKGNVDHYPAGPVWFGF